MANGIYLKLPAWAQNIALSLYGANLYRQRFQGSIPEIYKHGLNLFDAPDEAQYSQQNARLQKLLSHCKNHVPYYKEYLQNIDTSKVTAISLKNIVPVLTKTDILKNAELLVSTAPFLQGKLRTANTSGSSGTPLSIQYTNEARRINYQFYESALKQFGCTYRSKSTTFAGRILYKEPGTHPARYDYNNKTQYLSSYFISPATIENYVNALNSWKPEFIDAYPSAIYELIKLADKKGLKFNFSTKCILTSSETLTDEHRSTIENAFNTTVIDHYGCTEMAINAVSIGENYFASALYSVIELEHQFDNTYSVITTGLLNFGMPFLRYKIGDLVDVPQSTSNYIFSKIEGRIDDLIITPEGRKIGRMDPVFKGIEGISNAQIVQEKIDLIRVLIVLDSNSKKEFLSSLLIDNIKERTSPSMGVEIQYVKELTKGKNGKLKSVVSKLK